MWEIGKIGKNLLLFAPEKKKKKSKINKKLFPWRVDSFLKFEMWNSFYSKFM